MALSPLRPAPATRLATELLTRRLGTHLVADETVNRHPELGVFSETVLYETLTGQFRVSLMTDEEGSIDPITNGTIAEVRVVEGQQLSDAVEVGCPRISIVRSESQPIDRRGDLGFDLQVSSGTVSPRHAEVFADALGVANALIDRLRSF